MFKCLVVPSETHTSTKHSCLTIGKRTVTASCFNPDHGKGKIPSNTAGRILKWFKLKYMGDSELDKENPYEFLRNSLLQVAGENDYRRDEEGNVWKPINGLNYAYEMYQQPREFLNNVLDEDEFSKHPDNMDKMLKFMRNFNHSSFPFIKRDRFHLGFTNGVLNIDTCEFIPADEVEDGLTVRKFFHEALDMTKETPLFDMLIKHQFPDDGPGGEHEGVFDFILMSLGRLFFKVKERDEWQYMLYLEGQPGTGRSTLINVVTDFFNNVGTISSGYEKVFGLSALYDKEIIITDDLPEDFKKVFPQTDLQSMVSGGFVGVRPHYSKQMSVPWTTPCLFGGNWSLDYYDRGQVTRRVTNAVWEVEVTKPDPTLETRIIQQKLGSIIYKCLSKYKTYRSEHGGKGVWDFVPVYFTYTRDQMRMERNVLFRFLKDDTLVTEGKGETPLTEVKKAFEKWLGKPFGKLEKSTFTQANRKWKVSQKKLCKFCKNEHKAGCCPKYDRLQRTCCPNMVTNLQ